jgi:inhibitor of KinA sporulation pathway (predicted exonuclease)
MDLPREFIIFDTEYTAWEGSRERKWNLPHEHREIIEIGAIEIKELNEVNYFDILVRPAVNPDLSAYIRELTGITQESVDNKGVRFADALTRFYTWSKNLPFYSYGPDWTVLEENAELISVPYPFKPAQFHDIREYFRSRGINTDKYMSSTISEAFGVPSPYTPHTGLSDARSLLVALRASQNI